MKNEVEHRRAWQNIASMNISYYSGDLSPLLDAVLAFFPTNSETQVKKYQKTILKMFHKNYDITWYVSHRDNTGITKIIAIKPY